MQRNKYHIYYKFLSQTLLCAKNSMNDPKNIVGIGNLIPVSDPDDAARINKIEQDIVNGANITDIGDDIDAAREFKDEMARLTASFMMGHDPTPSNSEGFLGGETHENNNDESETNVNLDKQESSDSDPFAHFKPNSDTVRSSYDFVPKDPRYQRATVEEQKQRHINSVLNDIEDDELGIDIDKDREEDEKANLLEQIDMLRDTLEDDGINIGSVPSVTKNSSIGDIRNVHKMLRLKNDRNRYCSFAEEMILAGAHGAEYLFDGEKEWFGRKPDLVGWPETVKVKLRRMRYDTSTFVQEIMSAYNMSPLMRLFVEILPSAFLYSRKRKTTQNDTLIKDLHTPRKRNENDLQYKDAIASLNSL